MSYWKFRRELGRLGLQLLGLVERLTDPIAQRRLDQAVEAGLPQVEGALPDGEKIALYLIHQPAGISVSTLNTCRSLSLAGYTPFVVSNAHLSATDRDRLKAVVWRAVERPNFGYDFGGYRDGLACLRQWSLAPEELLILNDSVWLPISPESDLFERLESEPSDIAGTILRTRGTERFLESYLYRLRRPALEHPAFLEFWDNLRLTSNKYHVIRRGERGFSAAMRNAGLKLTAVYDGAALVELITQQNEDFLRLTLRYGAYMDSDLAAEATELLTESGPNWRKNALAHVQKVLTKRLAYSTFPFANVRLANYPLLKKSSDPINRAWRRAYIAAVDAKDLPPPPATMLEEIRARDVGSRWVKNRNSKHSKGF